MKNKKIKIPQYLVRGKNRNYNVLVFPKKKWLWAYYEGFDERYEIDGDAAAYQQVKYALAALLANPGKIAYFPIHDDGYGEYFKENYDAVLVRPELQFRRSEWVSLRRQLDETHRIKSFELRYEPEKLYVAYNKFTQNTYVSSKFRKREKKSSARLENGTVFFALKRESCYYYHHAIINEERLVMGEGGWPDMFSDMICEIGWMITPKSKGFMRQNNAKIAQNEAQRKKAFELLESPNL